uniref:Reverse transcriptase Ty1/copia-type domain-containing protein n=1 Tax=Solanum lycopersicum TaxID=4081 RepID=A0A3Q7IJJ2_SOLLC
MPQCFHNAVQSRYDPHHCIQHQSYLPPQQFASSSHIDACAGRNGVANSSVNLTGTNHFFSHESNHVKWIVDTGATNHMIGDHRYLMNGGFFPADEIEVLPSDNVVVPNAEHIEVLPSVVAVPVDTGEVRKPTRGSKPPIWHKDYLIKTGSSSCTYFIGDNIDYTAGFQQSAGDYSLFTKKEGEKIVIILVYVDDLLLTDNDGFMIQHTKDVLHTTFKIKDLGELKYFLGIEFARSEAGILMHQKNMH